jgi:hypothetical protein
MLLHDGPAVEPPRRRRLHRTSVFIAPKLYVTNYVPQNVSVSLGTFDCFIPDSIRTLTFVLLTA